MSPMSSVGRPGPGDARGRRWAAVLLGAVALIALAPSGPGQQRPKEDVTVTLVEVPVRVLLKGVPVRDLVRGDFEVFENGVRQDITRFESVSRAIASPRRTQATAGDHAGRPAPRLFLLVFNVFDYEETVGAAVDHFFSEIFGPGDRVLVVVEDRVLNVELSAGIDDLASGVKEALKTFKAISTAEAVKAFRDVEHEADNLLAALRSERSHAQAMIRFFENYQRAWEAYRAQFLEPDPGFYRGLVRRIKGVEGEKWAICIQQREMFPKVKSASRLDNEIRAWIDSQVDPQAQVMARLVEARYAELQRSFDLASKLSPDVLGDLFLSAGVTFHLILLRSGRTILSQNFEFREVGQDFENAFKAVSRTTGGLAAFSAEPAEALAAASRQEDHHYLLVYSPREPSSRKQREIQVKVGRPGVDVLHLKTYVEDGPPAIAIAGLETGPKTLRFTLRHYEMTTIDNKRTGQASVKVTLYDGSSKQVFAEGRTLELIKSEIRISLSLDRLAGGEYFLIIEAFDKLSGQSDVYSGPVRI